MDKEFMLWLNKKLEEERYRELALLYFDECESEEAVYLNVTHLSEFLQKHCEIKDDEEEEKR